MKNTRNDNGVLKLYVEAISFLLIVLFVYTASSKLIDFPKFKMEMYHQTLPHRMLTYLIYSVPPVELTVSALLLFRPARLIGFYLSTGLMSLFTGYTLLVLLNYFEHVPCSCGGVIASMGWKSHLLFNSFFLLLSVLGIYMTNRERSSPG